MGRRRRTAVRWRHFRRRQRHINAGLPPDTYIRSWQGIALKAGSPKAVLDKLHQAVLAAADTPAFRARARAWQLGSEVVTSKTPDAFQQFHNAELERWTGVIKAAGIKPQ